MKQQDADWVQELRVGEQATDQEIQEKLKQLYTSAVSSNVNSNVQYNAATIQMTSGHAVSNQFCQTLMAIGKSSIEMDQETKVQWMQKLMSEDPYAQILQQFSDDPTCREQIRQGRKFRLKSGSLCLYEENQESGQRYWRIIVPDDQDIKTSILKELHCVPFAGHPGYTRTLQMAKRFFYWSHMTPEGGTPICPRLPRLPGRKR